MTTNLVQKLLNEKVVLSKIQTKKQHSRIDADGFRLGTNSRTN